jgi:glutamate dehydrogenase/leucine dehydrogenase
MSKGEKERVARTFAARIEPVVGAWSDVPAPDVNTGGQEMVWFMVTISKMRGRLEPAISQESVSLWVPRAVPRPPVSGSAPVPLNFSRS